MGVSVRQKNGSWYTFTRVNGERAAQRFESEAEANAVAAAIRNRIALGEFDLAAMRKKSEDKKAEDQAKPSLPTLKEFFDKTMTPLWEALAPATYKRYETSFRVHVEPVLGGFHLDELNREVVKKFIVSLLKKPAAKRAATEEGQAKESERKLSQDSIRNVNAVLRGTLTEAVEQGYLAANPASKLGRFYSEAGKVREEVDPFNIEEIPVLLSATLEHFGIDHYSLLLTAFHTGMRSSEIAGVCWNDVDFKNRFITVRRQYKDGQLRKTKTKKIRKVDISDVLLKELQALRKRRQAEYLGRGTNEIPQWVFLSPGLIIWKEGEPVGRKEGEPVDMKNFYNRVFLKACDKAKLRRRRFHDCRHSFASILLMAGESPAYVRDQLGHSSIKMTVDVYGHFIPGANRQAVNKLPSLTTVQSEQMAIAGH